MNTDKKLRFTPLVITFLLAAFIFFTSSTNVLAADNSSPDALRKVEKQLSIEDGVNNFISLEEREKLLDPAQIPAQRQPIIDRADPDSKLLEKVVQMFKDVTESTSKQTNKMSN